MRPGPVVLLVIGVLLLLVSLAADPLGIGEGTGVGWKQIAGAIIGGVLAAVGMARLRKSGTF